MSAATDLCTQRCQFPPLNRYAKPENRALDPSVVPSGDANGSITDIYRRTTGVRPSSPWAIVNASYDGGQGQANGPSVHPQISRTGRLVVFESSFTNRIGGWETGPTFPVDPLPKLLGWYYANTRNGQPLQTARDHAEAVWAHWPTDIGWVEGSVINPAISSRGNYVGFTSDGAGHFGELNGPGIADVFAIYNRQTLY